MQIYTENRFCLPLFYLIVLGVALSIWICPDKAFATGASSGVHDDQPRQAPEGLPPSRMPEAFPGFWVFEQHNDVPDKCVNDTDSAAKRADSTASHDNGRSEEHTSELQSR